MQAFLSFYFFAEALELLHSDLVNYTFFMDLDWTNFQIHILWHHSFTTSRLGRCL